jgi:hypothetical protein
MVTPYNHNPPMHEHSQSLRERAASSYIYCKISMVFTCLDIIFLDQIEGGSIVIAVYIYRVFRNSVDYFIQFSCKLNYI